MATLDAPTIVSAVIVLFTVILLLRITYFRDRTSKIVGDISTASSKAKVNIATEIKKGNVADVEAVIGMVNGLSTLEAMSRQAEELKRSMSREYTRDFFSIGSLVLLAVYSGEVSTLTSLTILIGYILLAIPFWDIMGFIQDVNQCFKIEDKMSQK